MSKIEDAKHVLEALGLPIKQQNDRSALVLLALCNLKEDDQWIKAVAISMSVVGNKVFRLMSMVNCLILFYLLRIEIGCSLSR